MIQSRIFHAVDGIACFRILTPSNARTVAFFAAQPTPCDSLPVDRIELTIPNNGGIRNRNGMGHSSKGSKRQES